MTGRPLRLLGARYAVCRLPADAPAPDWVGGEFQSCSRTPVALTVVCEEAFVPAGVEAERGFRTLVVTGTLPFDEVGVLAALAGPLARAGIPIFAVGVHETDYVLVPAARLDAALAALRAAGHVVA